MDKTAKLYCHWAAHGMAMHNSGGALVCCHSRTFLKDNNSQQIFWHTHTLDDAWNSPTRQEIHRALEEGVQHPNCSACWDEENVGMKSRRQHHNELDIIESNDVDVPLLLDLKLGNICNLSCRTCNPYVSSQWTKDWWRVYEIKNDRFKSYDDYFEATFGTGRASYDKDNDKFWDKLNEWLPHAQYIDIYGAEPMLIHRLFDVLQHSIDQGYAKNQTLHFNTNATIWNQRYIDILNTFKRVYIDVSIDGLYEHYDYIRNGETWAVVDQNLKLYQAFDVEFQHQSVSACITVSIFNIFYLDEIYTHLSNRFHSHFNMAHMPYNINIKILPDEIKQIIIDKFSKSTNQQFKKTVEPVLAYMTEPLVMNYPTQVNQWDEFVRATWELDQLRSQNFATTFPEFYNLLKPYLRGQWE